jgi:hypothetical protein
MFPNVRLLIAAVLASVVVLSCGFAVFAALRVNHEPLTRLPAESAALQLVASNPGPPAATLASGQPFGSVTQSIAAQIAGATARLKALDLDHRHDAKPAEAVSATSSEPAPLAANAADTAVTPSAIVIAPPAPAPPIANSAPQPPSAAAASDIAPSPQQPVTQASDPPQAPAETTAAAPTQPLPPTEPVQNQSDGVTITTGAASTVVTAEPAAIAQPADQDQPVAHTAPDKHLAAKRTKAPRRKIARKVGAPRRATVVARRVIRARRVAPAVAQPNAQSFAYSQPTFQAGPQPFQQAAPQSFQQGAPQLIQRTALLRPRRMIKKAAVRRSPAKKTALVGPVVKPQVR